MKLTGKLVKNTRIVSHAVVEKDEAGISFRDALEDCLIQVCRKLDIQVPMWFKSNTSEFAALRKTIFTADHFIEKIKFDKFEIEVIE